MEIGPGPVSTAAKKAVEKKAKKDKVIGPVTGQGPTKPKKIIRTNGLSPHKELNGPG
jgi:hypothetical protein